MCTGGVRRCPVVRSPPRRRHAALFGHRWIPAPCRFGDRSVTSALVVPGPAEEPVPVGYVSPHTARLWP